MFGYFLTAPVVGKNMALLVFNVSDLALPMNLEHKPMKSEKIFLYEKIGHEVKTKECGFIKREFPSWTIMPNSNLNEISLRRLKERNNKLH